MKPASGTAAATIHSSPGPTATDRATMSHASPPISTSARALRPAAGGRRRAVWIARAAGIRAVLARHPSVDARVRQIHDQLVAVNAPRAHEAAGGGLGVAHPQNVRIGLERAGEGAGHAHRVAQPIEPGLDPVALDAE